MAAVLERETALVREPVRAPEAEVAAIQELDMLLTPTAPPQKPPPPVARLISPSGKELELPLSVYKVLRQIIHDMARGKAVTIAPVDAELTTQRAADLLNISRPYLIKLLEANEIPFQKVGTHRRIKLQDVLEYRRKRSARQRAALDEMAQSAQEMGIYD
jgi:excisionase family DNA binding protein